MLRVLEKERMLFIDGRPRRVPWAASLLDAWDPLSKWVQLAREVLCADFPQFEVVQAFGALRLRTRHEQRELASIVVARRKQIEHLPKVANMLELDVNYLLAQFFQHLPIAQFVCCRDGCESLVAWRDAVYAADRRQRHQRQAA
jgi:hypothetical protein